MHANRSAEATVDFYGLSIDVLDQSGDITIANVEHGIDNTETRLALSYLRSGEKTLIAGGGLGGQAALVASKIGVESVIVVEANPYLVPLLRHHVRVRGRSLDIRHGALWRTDGEGPFSVCPPDVWPASSVLANACSDPELVAVPYRSANRIIRDEGVRAAIIDIEGSEYDLMEDLALARLRVLVIEFHDGRSDLLERQLVTSGFEVKRNDGGRQGVIGAVRKDGG